MRRRVITVALLLSGVFALSIARGQSRPAAARTPDVLLITLDTTRADRMGFLGSTRGLTPALDALARTATVFTRAYAQAPITTVSHATILTGTYPPLHGVDDFGAPLPASVPYLPELLRRRGYRTAAFVGSIVLDPRQRHGAGIRPRLLHLRRRISSAQSRRGSLSDARTARRRSGGARRALARRALPRSPSEPFFAWVHLFDPHDPYDPPADLKQRFAAAPYDGEIAAVDRAVGTLVAAAGADTLIVVAADHGESLGGHGETTHGVFLYEESLHVPLLIRFPQRQAAGVRVTTRVRLADIAPTVLESVGMPVPPRDAWADLAAAAGGDSERATTARSTRSLRIRGVPSAGARWSPGDRIVFST